VAEDLDDVEGMRRRPWFDRVGLGRPELPFVFEDLLI